MKSKLSSLGAVIAALAASTCCVGPLMGLAGMLGVSASHLIWLSSIKNYLITFSLIAITYNLYRAYFPKKQNQCCSVDNNNPLSHLNDQEKKQISFLRSKSFLWSIAIVTILIIILPYLIN